MSTLGTDASHMIMREIHFRSFKGSGKDLTGKATHAKGSSEIAEGRVDGTG